MDLVHRLELPTWAFLAAAAITLVATPVAAWLARYVGAIDEPGEDRRIHRRSTPRLGGVAVCAGVLTASAVFIEFGINGEIGALRAQQLAVILAGGACICLLGVLDDIWGIAWWAKLAGQAAVATGVVVAPLALPAASGVADLVLPVQRLDPPLLDPVLLPGAVGVGLAVLWIVALMNMMNFIDGVDGLASGVTAISAGTFAIIAASYSRINVAVLAAATCGAALAFLRHNFRRGGASIFLGDSGSMLLGYLLAVISIQGVIKTSAAISLVIPLAMLAVPIIDTAFVVAKRLKYRLPVSAADRWHLHHRLLNVGYSPRRVTVAFWAWTASMSAVAIALRFIDYGNSEQWRWQGLAGLAAVALVAVAVSIYIAVRLEIIKTRAVRERNRRLAAERATAITAAADGP